MFNIFHSQFTLAWPVINYLALGQMRCGVLWLLGVDAETSAFLILVYLHTDMFFP